VPNYSAFRKRNRAVQPGSISQLPFSSPGEFPKQRSREDGFSGLTDLLAHDERPITPALLKLDPIWDPLRADPAFQKLCEEKQP
jgi:hypothetical protein